MNGYVQVKVPGYECLFRTKHIEGFKLEGNGLVIMLSINNKSSSKHIYLGDKRPKDIDSVLKILTDGKDKSYEITVEKSFFRKIPSIIVTDVTNKGATNANN